MDSWILAAVAVGLGIARFIVPVAGSINKADIFKDMAHVVVGFMFGYAATKKRWQLWAIAIGLTVLEVVAFVIRKD